MTVKELVSVLHNAQKVGISWGGCIIPFDAKDPLALEIYEDYVVSDLRNNFELESYEISIAVQFLKEPGRDIHA